jgi:hypothetical protein
MSSPWLSERVEVEKNMRIVSSSRVIKPFAKPGGMYSTDGNLFVNVCFVTSSVFKFTAPIKADPFDT